jgi:hypothetical protein
MAWIFKMTNKRAAGKGRIAPLFYAGHALLALPEHKRWPEYSRLNL